MSRGKRPTIGGIANNKKLHVRLCACPPPPRLAAVLFRFAKALSERDELQRVASSSSTSTPNAIDTPVAPPPPTTAATTTLDKEKPEVGDALRDSRPDEQEQQQSGVGDVTGIAEGHPEVEKNDAARVGGRGGDGSGGRGEAEGRGLQVGEGGVGLGREGGEEREKEVLLLRKVVEKLQREVEGLKSDREVRALVCDREYRLSRPTIFFSTNTVILRSIF